MDENSKDIIGVVGKRVLVELKEEFLEFTTVSPLYIALAALGLIAASWGGLVVALIVYIAIIAYNQYKEVEQEIMFDIADAKAESTAKEAQSPIDTTSTVEEVKTDTDKQ